MSSTIPVTVDDDLLALVDAQATAGHSRDAVIAAALRRGLGAGKLAQILDAGRSTRTLSEDDAMALAQSELDALRAERRGA